MEPRRSAAWLLLVAGLAGCGSDPQPQELAEDYAPSFGGTWYGTASYVYRENGQVTGTFSRDVSQLILVSGKNTLQLPQYCSASDYGLTGSVISSTEFKLEPRECSASSGGCSLTIKLESGGGKLNGDTLQLAFHGTVVQQASAGCPAATAQYDITSPMTRSPASSTTLEVPENLTASRGDFYSVFNLSWTLDTSQYVEVQARIGSAVTWSTVATAYGTQASVQLDTSTPERTPVSFRVRTTNGSQASDWSSEASSDFGLTGPWIQTADGSSGAVRLSWQARSDVTGLLIERSAGAAPTQSWTTVTTVAPPETSYVDDQVEEGRTYGYRLTWLDGSFRGFPSSSLVQVGLRTPAALTAVPGVETVQLTWENRSSAATEIVVTRAPGLSGGFGPTELAHLPPTATSYTDVGVPTGLYTYSVQPRLGGSFGGVASVGVATLPPAASGTWQTAILTMPGTDFTFSFATRAALDDTDRLLVFSRDNGLVGSDQASWLPHALPVSSVSGQPYFHLDRSFRPHLVYLRTTVQGTNMNAVVHEWFDGTDWKSEELARLVAAAINFALEPSGRPVVLVSGDGTGPGLRVLRWSGSTYVVDDPGIVVGGAGLGLYGWAFAVSPEGKIHLVAQGYSGETVHASRGASWASEPVTLPTTEARIVDMTASTGDTLSLLSWDWTTSKLQLTTRTGSGWGSPVPLATSGGIDPANLRLGTSVNGSAPALALSTSSGLQIARASDGWTEHLLTSPNPLLGIGYDASDRLYVILSGGFVWGMGTQVVVYREQ
jgi:hypothetical protein